MVHRTETAEPQFVPLVAGEVWVRVREDTGFRHFHVYPQIGHGEVSVDEAVVKAEELNAAETEHRHRFEYYAVRVTADRSPVESVTTANSTMSLG